MAGIVIQLQEEALSKDTDILTLLRKAYLIARKLNLKDFEEWISCEQNGYGKEKQVPSYRHVTGEVKAWNPYHGWIPVLFDKDTPLDEHDLFDSLANLVNVYENTEGKSCLLNFPPELNMYLSQYGRTATKFSLHISLNQIYNVIEQVRNKILDWAITLEENGILGEGLQFTSEEKEKALNSPPVVSYTNNFYSAVKDSQIQQDTRDSTQAK